MGKFYLLFIFYLILTSCNKNKFVKDEILPMTYATYIDVYDIQSAQYVDSTMMYLYTTENDYLNQKNELLKDVAPKGRFKISIDPSIQKDYWFRIFKGKWNSERSKIFTSKGYPIKKSCGNCGTNEYSKSINICLSPTPTRLQLNVYDNGIPVPGAFISIFLTEQDYINKKRTNNNTYTNGFYNYAQYNSNNGIPSECDTLNKKTNSIGQALFVDFEPRQYWFEVRKEGKSNSTTRFTTNGQLSDNSNITTVLDIGLK